MRVSLKYGRSYRELHITEPEADVCLLETGRAPSELSEVELIRNALSDPIGGPTLSTAVTRGQRVAVLTSDITRPFPSQRVLPLVLGELFDAGVRDEDITVVFGLGSHRSHTWAEQVRLAGEAVFRRVRCIDSDPTNVELIGHTSRGTPVTVFRPVLEADMRVCLGALEYHYFVGYSGGYKAIIPGTSGLDTIKANHRMMTARGAVPGKWEGNPVREDIDEAGEMVGADFILNVILDGSKRVVSVVAGHPVSAHREGCARLDAFGRVTVEQRVDVVIVSAGGHPKDINLYQAQKALDSARHIVRPGGIILLVAECGEGLGNPTFEEWMTAASGPDEIIARIQEEFVLGGHKAAAVALAMKQAEIYVISALPSELVRSVGFHPFDTPKQALGHALAQAGGRATVAVIPEGGSLLAAVAERTTGDETHRPVT